jgi:hypothetical protein
MGDLGEATRIAGADSDKFEPDDVAGLEEKVIADKRCRR